VREFLPDVIVPELPDDPSEYIRAVNELNLFETTSFSAEDDQRSELYKQEARRVEASRGATSIEEFLQSLEMRTEVARFNPFHLQRISHRMLRSNQFTIRTQRRSLADCERLMNDLKGFTPLYATLEDRFGDHGLISIVVMEWRGNDVFL